MVRMIPTRQEVRPVSQPFQQQPALLTWLEGYIRAQRNNHTTPRTMAMAVPGNANWPGVRATMGPTGSQTTESNATQSFLDTQWSLPVETLSHRPAARESVNTRRILDDMLATDECKPLQILLERFGARSLERCLQLLLAQGSNTLKEAQRRELEQLNVPGERASLADEQIHILQKQMKMESYLNQVQRLDEAAQMETEEKLRVHKEENYQSCAVVSSTLYGAQPQLHQGSHPRDTMTYGEHSDLWHQEGYYTAFGARVAAEAHSDAVEPEEISQAMAVGSESHTLQPEERARKDIEIPTPVIKSENNKGYSSLVLKDTSMGRSPTMNDLTSSETSDTNKHEKEVSATHRQGHSEKSAGSEPGSGQKPKITNGSEPEAGQKPAIVSGSEPGSGQKPAIVSGSESESGQKPAIVSGSEPESGQKPAIVSGSEPESGQKPAIVSGSEPESAQKPAIVSGSESGSGQLIVRKESNPSKQPKESNKLRVTIAEPHERHRHVTKPRAVKRKVNYRESIPTKRSRKAQYTCTGHRGRREWDVDEC